MLKAPRSWTASHQTLSSQDFFTKDGDVFKGVGVLFDHVLIDKKTNSLCLSNVSDIFCVENASCFILQVLCHTS